MGITHQDAALLQNSLQNLGSDALRRRALDQQQQQEMSRMAMEQSIAENQGKRLDAQTAHFNEMEDKANEPKIQAYIADADDVTKGFLFQGNAQAYQNMLQAYKSKSGKDAISLPGPPQQVKSREPLATYRVGGVTKSFWDKETADKFEAALKANGVDPYTAKTDGKDYTTTTEDIPEKPEEYHTEGGFLGFGGKKVVDVPGAPAQRKVTRTYGGAGQPAALPAPPPAAAVGAGTPPQPQAAPTPYDVSWLASHNDDVTKAKFEQRFGPGSADKYLP